MSIVPGSKPQMDPDTLGELVEKNGYKASDLPELFVVGVRGYYKDTMGKPGVNDRGIYDDAIFLACVHDHTFASFNANTDPSSYRKGKGIGSAKGMACLKRGLYHSHQLGLHRGKYMALIQTGGEVTVVRDGTPDYEETGWFGINIHKGGYNTTSSLGCQTIHPDQWMGFIGMVQTLMHAHKQSVMPYLLIEA